MVVSPRILLGQVNSIYPKQHKLKVVSLSNDFSFIGKMFAMTGEDISYGINNAKKSYNQKRESRINR